MFVLDRLRSKGPRRKPPEAKKKNRTSSVTRTNQLRARAFDLQDPGCDETRLERLQCLVALGHRPTRGGIPHMRTNPKMNECNEKSSHERKVKEARGHPSARKVVGLEESMQGLWPTMNSEIGHRMTSVEHFAFYSLETRPRSRWP